MSSISTGLVSVLSAVFEATAESVENASIVLVTIDLSAYDGNPAQSLYLATREYVDPDGRRWDPVLAENPVIDHGGNWMEAGAQPVDALVRILDKRLSGQALTAKFSDLLVDYNFPRSRIHIQQAFDNLVSTSEFRTLFDGTIEAMDALTAEDVTFHCVQDRRWMVKCPPRVVTADSFPNAPSEAIGTALPILLGDGRSRRYLEHATTPGVIEATDAGIARGALPVLVVDVPTGTGLDLPKFLISDRDIDGSEATDARWFMVESTLGRLAGPGVGTLVNTAGGPATLELSNVVQKVLILPIEVDTTATNPGVGMAEILREDKPYNLEGRCELDYDAAERNAYWLMPDISELGKFQSADLIVFYAKDSWTGTLGDAIVRNQANTNATTQAFAAGASTTFPSTGFQQVTTIPIASNVIGDWSDIKNCRIEIAVKDAGQELHLYRVGVRVTYQAAAKIERPGTQRQERDQGYLANGRKAQSGDETRTRVYYTSRDVTSPDLVSFAHPLYGYFSGKLDDASGTYTGTAGALIEHPVDMVRYLLMEFGSVPASGLVEDLSQFGAFGNAKTALSGYEFLVHITRRENLDRIIAEIGDQCLCWFKRTPTSPGNPFTAIPWDVGSAVDYRSSADLFTFTRSANHVAAGSFRPGLTKAERVVNTLRANFDWDPRTNTYGQQVFITPTESRVWTGSAYGTDATRESDAADSEALYGTKEYTMALRHVVDPATATDILQRYFDLNVTVRVEVTFATWLTAYDLNRGHVIQFGDDWDSRYIYPRAGSDGSWGGKAFRVIRVKRPGGRPSRYMVTAVEV